MKITAPFPSLLPAFLFPLVFLLNSHQFGFSSASNPQIPSKSMLYKLPSDFNVTCDNTNNLFKPILISKESSFAWGLVISNDASNDHKFPTCSLSIVCYNCKAYYIAWSACCDGKGGTIAGARNVQLGKQRDLQLVDSKGLLLWSSKSLNVASIELLETGNLLLLDSQNSIIWQSFDNPSNILLPGQILKPGMSLTAGDYSAVMEPGGLALFVNHTPTPLPYLVVNSSWGLSDLNTVLNPICSGLSLAYAADGSTLMMELDMETGYNSSAHQGSSCYNASSSNKIQKFNQAVTSSVSSNSSGFRYLTLDYHGGLRTYVDDELDFSWFNQGVDDAGRGFCNLPSHCGEFGICDPGGECRCPHSLVNQSLNYLIATDYSVETPEVDDCPLIQAANCSISTNYEVLRLQDLDYFPHRYMPSSNKSSTLQACVMSCMQNCSCVIAFYNNLSSACHHYSKALSMQRTTYGGNYMVFIKIQPLDDPLIQKKSAANRRLNFIAIAIIFGTSLVVCLIIFMWVYWNYGRSDEDYGARLSRADDDVFLDSLAGLPPRYTFKQLQQITNGFSVKLGAGSFGTVYEGSLADGSKLAVKKLEGTRQGDKEFRAEVASLAGISHVNLVRLRGFCAEGAHRMLVYEYMTNGSLDRWLSRGGATLAGPQLDWQTRLKIAVDAARGLAFLHGESRERIFHLDVKPQNILLDENFVAKLSDFGLSKQMDRARSRTITSMRGTPGYLAPEWLLQTTVSDKSDVYSFGMVLLEVVSARRNVDYSSVDQDKWFWPAWVVKKAVTGQWAELRAELATKGCPGIEGERAIKVALWCVQEDPKTRPTMATILLMLEGLIHVADPPLEMSLTLEAQARLLAGFHPDHCSTPSPPPTPTLALGNCFSNPWSFATCTISTSAPLASSPPSPCLKPSLSI